MQLDADLERLGGSFRDTIHGRRAYGEPYERDGVVVIPAASVRGGSGSGGGTDASGNQGGGGGYGLSARPAGAFIIKGDDVRWEPAIDVTRIVVGAQVIVFFAILALRSVFKTRAKRRR